MAAIHKPLDRSTTFEPMLSVNPAVGPIVLLNIISLPRGVDKESFLKICRTADALKTAPGYISLSCTTLLEMVIPSSTTPKICEDFSEGTEFRASVLQKASIPGVCVGL
ncbi:hypothetical protein PENFLA_c023G06861 [Penicillium flavigenum]|uniref:Uncharacterized protein n=1 Tax=Penicillium flavigenum TaxID=254877 RepID=A0A1V6SUQ1_9EURO|nr:hypothetical protein PENFLA_c023G06861 [Penicillium flavigenum]